MDVVRDAKLSDFTAAVVELMITAYDGSLVDPGWPWVCEADELGVFWLDPEPMQRIVGVGGDLRLLPIFEALLGGRRVPDLVQILDQLDRRTLDLVLAAFARASVRERDLALYAFGGDPWSVAGRLVALQTGASVACATSTTRLASWLAGR